MGYNTRHVGRTVNIRVNPQDLMSCVDLISQAKRLHPRMSLAMVVRLALSGLLESCRKNGIVPQRDGFEFSRMMAPFADTPQASKLEIAAQIHDAEALRMAADENISGVDLNIMQRQNQVTGITAEIVVGAIGDDGTKILSPDGTTELDVVSNACFLRQAALLDKVATKTPMSKEERIQLATLNEICMRLERREQGISSAPFLSMAKKAAEGYAEPAATKSVRWDLKITPEIAARHNLKGKSDE